MSEPEVKARTVGSAAERNSAGAEAVIHFPIWSTARTEGRLNSGGSGEPGD